MTEVAQDIYKSQNGDSWRLVQDAASGRVFVRHEANPSSGGRITESSVEEFLSRGGSGPEYAALRRLVDELATVPTHDASRAAGPASKQPSAKRAPRPKVR